MLDKTEKNNRSAGQLKTIIAESILVEASRQKAVC